MRGGGSSTAILNVGCVQIVAGFDHFFDFVAVLIILKFLNVKLSPQSHQLSVLVFDSYLELRCVLRAILLRSLDQILQLHNLLVLGLESNKNFIILIPQTGDHHLLLLETLFNYADLLRISEGILAADDFLELCAESGALIDVKFHFDFDLSNLGRFDVSLKSFDLIGFVRDFGLQLANLSLQICCQMRFKFQFLCCTTIGHLVLS